LTCLEQSAFESALNYSLSFGEDFVDDYDVEDGRDAEEETINTLHSVHSKPEEVRHEIASLNQSFLTFVVSVGAILLAS
jgi:hypothetical protein